MSKVFILYYYATIFNLYPQSNIGSVKHSHLWFAWQLWSSCENARAAKRGISDSSTEHGPSCEHFGSLPPKSLIIPTSPNIHRFLGADPHAYACTIWPYPLSTTDSTRDIPPNSSWVKHICFPNFGIGLRNCTWDLEQSVLDTSSCSARKKRGPEIRDRKRAFCGIWNRVPSKIWMYLFSWIPIIHLVSFSLFLSLPVCLSLSSS